LALAAALPLSAEVVQIKLPPETAAFKPGPGAELANGQCLTCHSVEYVTTQPLLPRTFWAATVKKMRQAYGAAITDDQAGPLVDYLTRNYGVETNAVSPATASVAVSPAPPLAPGPALSGPTVAAKYGCLGCHNVDAKIVGPSYKDIAAKYSRDANAFARIAEQIHKGGSGKWGSILMPPFPAATDAETKTLAAWILSCK
jgi:sulfite dehydrogenase